MSKQAYYIGLAKALRDAGIVKSAQSGVVWAGPDRGMPVGMSRNPVKPMTGPNKPDTIADWWHGVPAIQRNDFEPHHMLWGGLLHGDIGAMGKADMARSYWGKTHGTGIFGTRFFAPYEGVPNNPNDMEPNEATRARYMLGDYAKAERIARNSGQGPISSEYGKPGGVGAIARNGNDAEMIAAAQKMKAHYEAPGGAFDVQQNPIMGRLRGWLGPDVIEKLKQWGPAIGLGAGALGLYGLLSRKDENESRLGRMARMGLLGAGLGAAGYGLYNMYQKGNAAMNAGKTASAPLSWDELDAPSKGYLTGFVKACRDKSVDPATFIPEELVKSADIWSRIGQGVSGGSALGGLAGAGVGLVTHRHDKKDKWQKILKDLATGGAIGAGVGGISGAMAKL